MQQVGALVKLIDVLSILFSVAAVAQQRLVMYECDNVESCSGNCKPNGREMSFLIDKAARVVKLKFYENGIYVAKSVNFDKGGDADGVRVNQHFAVCAR